MKTFFFKFNIKHQKDKCKITLTQKYQLPTTVSPTRHNSAKIRMIMANKNLNRFFYLQLGERKKINYKSNQSERCQL